MKTTIAIIFSLTIVLILYSCHKEEIPENKKSVWIKNAFVSLETHDYPRIKAISWWHENFDHSFLKINSSNKSLAAYKKAVNSSTFITTPRFDLEKLIAPISGIYHAAYPDFGGTEDVVTSAKISNFETLLILQERFRLLELCHEQILMKEVLTPIIPCKK